MVSRKHFCWYLILYKSGTLCHPLWDRKCKGHVGAHQSVENWHLGGGETVFIFFFIGFLCKMFYFIFYFILCLCVRVMCVGLCTWVQHPWKPEEGGGSHTTGVTGCWVLATLGPGKWTCSVKTVSDFNQWAIPTNVSNQLYADWVFFLKKINVLLDEWQVNPVSLDGLKSAGF